MQIGNENELREKFRNILQGQPLADAMLDELIAVLKEQPQPPAADGSIWRSIFREGAKE